LQNYELLPKAQNFWDKLHKKVMSGVRPPLNVGRSKASILDASISFLDFYYISKI